MRYKNGIKDLVQLISNREAHAMLISDFSGVYEYKDNKKRKSSLGIKLNSSCRWRSKKDFVLMLSFQSCQMLNDAEICH